MREENELYDMSDEELEQAFKTAKIEMKTTSLSDADIEEEITEPTEVEMEEGEEEGIESDLEQPDEDSDHDTSADEEADESEEDEPESEEEEPDGELDEEEDNSEDNEEEADEEAQPAQMHKFKANGREYEFTMDEIMQRFPQVFGQAMNYTKKMQEMKPWRKTIDAIEQAELSHNDVNLMIDVLKGDKDAIAEVIKRTGIDTLDLDTENSNYVAKDYGRDERTLELGDVIDSISKDAEFSTTQKILLDEWDAGSRGRMSDNPKLVAALHQDVKDGTFDKLQPMVDKLKLFDGGGRSDLEYYEMAAKEYFGKAAQKEQAAQAAEQTRLAEQKAKEKTARLEQVKAQEAARVSKKKASSKRKAAATTKAMAGNRGIDVFDDSDEAFEKWYAEVEAKM